MGRRAAVAITPLLIKAIVRAETPRGWTTHFRRDRGTNGGTVRTQKTISIPHTRTGYRCLWVFFHEVGHALRMIEGKFHAAPTWARFNNSVTSSHEEWIAEEFAVEMLTRYGFPISPRELLCARRDVAAHVRVEEEAGLPIYEGVRRFAQPNNRRRKWVSSTSARGSRTTTRGHQQNARS